MTVTGLGEIVELLDVTVFWMSLLCYCDCHIKIFFIQLLIVRVIYL